MTLKRTVSGCIRNRHIVVIPADDSEYLVHKLLPCLNAPMCLN